MNEEATSTKPLSWQPYRGSNSRTGPPHHFSRRISPRSNSGPLPQDFPGSAAQIWAAPGAAPGNSSIAHSGCNPKSGSADHRPFRGPEGIRASVLFCALRRIALAHPVATASCGTLLLTLLKLGRWSGSSRAASRSPSLAPSSQNGCWSRRFPTPAVLPPDTPRRPAPDRRPDPRPTGDQARQLSRPRIRRHDGAGCRPERLKARARTPHQGLRLENPG